MPAAGFQVFGFVGWEAARLPECCPQSYNTLYGETIADYDGAGRLDDEAHRKHNVGMKGQIGLQIHPGDELLIRFKDIMVRELK